MTLNIRHHLNRLDLKQLKDSNYKQSVSPSLIPQKIIFKWLKCCQKGRHKSSQIFVESSPKSCHPQKQFKAGFNQIFKHNIFGLARELVPNQVFTCIFSFFFALSPFFHLWMKMMLKCWNRQFGPAKQQATHPFVCWSKYTAAMNHRLPALFDFYQICKIPWIKKFQLKGSRLRFTCWSNLKLVFAFVVYLWDRIIVYKHQHFGNLIYTYFGGFGTAVVAVLTLAVLEFERVLWHCSNSGTLHKL